MEPPHENTSPARDGVFDHLRRAFLSELHIQAQGPERLELGVNAGGVPVVGQVVDVLVITRDQTALAASMAAEEAKQSRQPSGPLSVCLK